jgi:hypothetical protein
MEVIEIVSYFLNESTRILEVSFRMVNDSEEMIRLDKIDYSLVEDYGYDLISQDFDLFEDEEEDGFDNIADPELDSDEIVLFLNEYYMINPGKIPESEFY